MRWLGERGLVEDIREEAAPRRRMIRMTEKGRKVAELLQLIENRL
jgi:DNA-binding MarR family transcriptional regulator